MVKRVEKGTKRKAAPETPPDTSASAPSTRRRLTRMISQPGSVDVEYQMVAKGGRAKAPVLLKVEEIDVGAGVVWRGVPIKCRGAEDWIAKLIIGPDMLLKKAECLRKLLKQVFGEFVDAATERQGPQVAKGEPQVARGARVLGLSDSESEDGDGGSGAEADDVILGRHYTGRKILRQPTTVVLAGTSIQVFHKKKRWYVKASREDVGGFVEAIMERFDRGDGEGDGPQKQDGVSLTDMATSLLLDSDKDKIFWAPTNMSFSVKFEKKGRVAWCRKGLSVKATDTTRGKNWTHETLREHMTQLLCKARRMWNDLNGQIGSEESDNDD